MSKSTELVLSGTLAVFILWVSGIPPLIFVVAIQSGIEIILEIIDSNYDFLIMTVSGFCIVVIATHAIKLDDVEQENITQDSKQTYQASQIENWWEVLGVSPTVTLLELKREYRKIAKSTHPDALPKGKGNVEMFRKVNTAFEKGKQHIQQGVV